MKSPLHAQREALEQLWEQGLSGHSLLRSHSRLVDEFILESFQVTEVAGAAESVALVALGGYGRQELFPYSDIDLMILYRPGIADEIGKITDAVLYPLWDTGLDVGHGVRTVQESLQHAGEDFFFRVAMLDARLIGGSQLLFFELLSGMSDAPGSAATATCWSPILKRARAGCGTSRPCSGPPRWSSGWRG